ncbi:hypothetical protein RCZ04_11430 [Capnocytophaga sp. HP1101]
MKKNVILLILSMLLLACNITKTPKCSDEQVKKLVLEMLQEKMKDRLKDDFILNNLNSSDLRDYAYTNNISYDEVLKKEREKIEVRANQYVAKYFENLSIKNILTQQEPKEGENKKCSCEATVKSDMLQSMRISYTVQIDDEGQFYIVLEY